jgi:hypothetical protein
MCLTKDTYNKLLIMTTSLLVLTMKNKSVFSARNLQLMQSLADILESPIVVLAAHHKEE